MRLIINSSKLPTIENKIRFNLPYSINIHEFHIINCSIPYSFFNINENNNKITFNGVEKEIPAKQYNAVQLQNALKSLLPNVNVIFDRQSLKYTFTSTSPFQINATSLKYILGTNDNQLITGTIVLGGDTVFRFTCPNACDMTNRIHNLYIKSNISPLNIFENQVQGNGILYRIPILCKFGDIIYYQNTGNHLNTEINRTLNVIDIELTDTFGVPINLNGLTYQIEFYMRTDDDDELIKNYRALMGGNEFLSSN